MKLSLGNLEDDDMDDSGDIIMLNDDGTADSAQSSPSHQRIKSFDMTATGSFVFGKHQKSKVKLAKVLSPMESRDDFQLLSLLGSGASGTVHKAEHKQSQKICALKSIDFTDVNKRKQLKDEITAFVGLTNPNIVQVLGACIDQHTGSVLIALEYMSMGSWQTFIDNNHSEKEEEYYFRNENKVKTACKEIIDALCFLQDRKLIHRDIKPANILVDSMHHHKLADFGIAKDVESNDMAQTQIGTMLYMSPERMKGLPYSFQCDVWSFGLSLLTTMLGYFPYSKDSTKSALGLLLEITESPSPDTTQIHMIKDWSIEFHSFMEACLTKDSQLRWTANDLKFHPFIHQIE